MFICQHCARVSNNINSHKNHERLCPKNEDRIYVSKTLGKSAWNKGLTKQTDIRVKKYSDSLVGNKHIGKCLDPVKELERRAKLSLSAKKQGFGGYQPNAGHSRKFKVLDSLGKEVTLQSTYELKCSKILDELKINWIRPKALMYDGKRYFADFYLLDFDLYLDPKNNFKAMQDEEKIQKVIDQNNVRIIVLKEKELTNEFIASVIQW